MSLLKAFERNIGRVSVVRPIRITAKSSPIPIGIPQLPVNHEEVSKMIADSQASILADEVTRLRVIISDLQSQFLNLLTKFEQYKSLTTKLAEETGKMAEVRNLCKQHGKKGIYVRDAKSVAKRWAAWKQLYDQGMTEGEIAARYGVDLGTVAYAKSKSWVNVRNRNQTTNNKGNQ